MWKGKMQSLVLTSTELEKSSSFITVDEGKNVKQLRILSFNSIFFIFTGIKRQDSLVTWSSYSLFISKYSYPSSSRKSSGEENLSSSSNSHRFSFIWNAWHLHLSRKHFTWQSYALDSVWFLKLCPFIPRFFIAISPLLRVLSSHLL